MAESRKPRKSRPGGSPTVPSKGRPAQSVPGRVEGRDENTKTDVASAFGGADAALQATADSENGSVSAASSSKLAWYRRPWPVTGVVVGTCLMLLSGWVFGDWYLCYPAGIQPTFVGRATCARCHVEEAKLFEGSHHDLAMDVASPNTVLGNFDNASLEHDGTQTRFFMRDSRYWVETEGPEGKPQEFQVTHVFGVEPLQQYIVQMDRPSGLADNCLSRAQVLRVSWDTTKGEWFYLRPSDVDEKLSPGDPLHWTGITQCWNTSCADCHSTNVVKGFDTELLDYRTTFSEIDVSCEACHGPGSLHVSLAESQSLFWDRRYGYGIVDFPKSEPRREVEACARCHSRRFVLDDQASPGEPFCNVMSCELPSPGIYYPDGQILDEDFEFGSFTQSKMYHNRIRCSDCHDPHTARVRYRGNAVCTSCHQHPPNKYDVPEHHHHKSDTPGAQCVNCHMPESIYMEVDGRRDHSIRLPRPDLSVELQTPNACTQCHLSDSKLPEEKREALGRYQDWLVAARSGDQQVADELKRLDQWSADALVRWYGPKERPASVAPLLQRAWDNDPTVERELSQWTARLDTPVIMRAAVLRSLMDYAGDDSLAAAFERLSDSEPMLVANALLRIQTELRRLLNQIDFENSNTRIPGRDELDRLITAVVPLLEHEALWVRNEAVRTLAILGPVQGRLLTSEQRAIFQTALEHLESSLEQHADRSSTHFGLGLLYEDLAQFADAQRAYRMAIRVEPNVVGPRSNLANLLSRQAEAARAELQQFAVAAQQGRPVTSQDRSRFEAIAVDVQTLEQEILKLRAEELPFLELDAQRAPHLPMLQYRLGMLLHLNGRLDDASRALERAYLLAPEANEFLLGYIVVLKEQKRWAEALPLAQELVARDANPSYALLLQEIQAQLRANLRE